MKKTIMTLALIVAVGITGINMAEAGWGGCNGPGGWNSDTSFTYEDMEKFHDDTADLRKQMFEKRNEYYEAMNQETPDKERAQQIWSEMFDLQNAMHAKALANGMMPGYGMRGRF